MMQHSANGLRPFEVSVYNKEVRRAVKDNKSHDIYGDHWADTQVQDVMAADETEAQQIAAMRFPSEDGFVVEELTPSRG